MPEKADNRKNGKKFPNYAHADEKEKSDTDLREFVMMEHDVGDR